MSDQVEHVTKVVDRLRVIRLMLGWQLVVALGLGCAGLAFGPVAGLSALLGGLVCWAPNLYFAFRAFRYRGARAARLIVRSFYAGAAGKLILSMALFAIVFIRMPSVNPLALFVGFIGVQSLAWWVPLVVSHRERRENV